MVGGLLPMDLMEMDASEIDHEGVSSSHPSDVKNIVMVGETGSGKSATGNSILGRKAFKSMFSTTGVTRTCETHITVLENGQSLAVIDTPGLFDYSAEPEFIHKEMLKCMDMVKDRIHAILLTMSIRTRFSREEEAGLLMLQNFFGPEIMDYMIVVFTGGDQFEEYDMTLDDYLSGTDCPDLLKETLRKCGNRRVLFNNKTKDEAEKSEQLKQLHALLVMVSDTNGGKPYSKKLCVEPKISLMEVDAKEFDHEGVSSSPPSEVKNIVPARPSEVKNIVLVGRTGNGKSATGNSILGRKAFKSMFRTTGVTRTCETHTTVLENGQSLAVIDTPGLFDYSAEPEFIHNEMLKCMDMAKDRIHAILLTMSIRTRFSREEEAGLLMLQNFFGPEIMDYMIVVFTGGDQFEEYDMTLDDYLSGTDCPDLLKETLRKCGNRRVLFNNKTKDEAEKSEQLKQLHALLIMVSDKNGGKPYTRVVVDTNGGKPYSKKLCVEPKINLMEMDASGFDHKGVSASRPSEVKNILLVGKTGNGKSATGNSILGRKAFKSMFRTTGVTRTCETHTTVLENGQSLAVIDTPGLFDYSAGHEFIQNEMLKCKDMAKGGIHAILLIVSIRSGFSREEEDGVSMVQNFFGPGIMDYMIVVFTGGDQFEEYDMTLDEYLSGTDCPDLLKETLRKCGNRRVLFNNKTRDEGEKSEQLKQLQTLLNTVADKNGGKPCTHAVAVVDTNGGRKPYTHAVVDINGGKPYTTVVDTNGGKHYTKKQFLEPKKEVSAFHLSQHATSDISAYKGATKKPHDRIAKVDSFKKEDDIVELGDQLVRRLHEGQLENARLKAENNMLVDQMESQKKKFMLLLEIETAKRTNDQNLQSRDGPFTRTISTMSQIPHIFSSKPKDKRHLLEK